MSEIAILCMSGDWTDGAPGRRSRARIYASGEYAQKYDQAVVYFAATNTIKYPDMICMAAAMQSVFDKKFLGCQSVVLTGDEEWSSRGEFRKFFAQIKVGQPIVLVSGQYHLDRLQIILEAYHPEHAPFVQYHQAVDDQTNLSMRVIEIPKRWLVKQSEARQQKLRQLQQRWLKFLPV